jgi:hypothetical protein
MSMPDCGVIIKEREPEQSECHAGVRDARGGGIEQRVQFSNYSAYFASSALSMRGTLPLRFF